MRAPRFHMFVIATILMAFLAPANAGLVSTSEALDLEVNEARAQVTGFMSRDDVAAELAALGVDPALALARVEAMSAQELEEIAGRIDELPAGAGLIEILGITFLVLLILHLTGVVRLFGR